YICFVAGVALCVCQTRARPPPRSALFPYTTLFRSALLVSAHHVGQAGGRPEDAVAWAVAAGATDAGLQYTLVDAAVVSAARAAGDRKSTRLNSSHVSTSYAGLCLKKKRSRYTNRTL